jgi:hypothetical protein
MNLGESLLEREATTAPEPTLVIRIPGFISSVANSASEPNRSIDARHHTGLIFWLTRKKLVGSYLPFKETRRS